MLSRSVIRLQGVRNGWQNARAQTANESENERVDMQKSESTQTQCK